MKKRFVVILVVAFCVGGALAQEGEPAEAEQQQAQSEAESTETQARQRVEDLRERLRRAIRLPRTREQSREDGATEEQVREVLRTGRERGVRPGDMQEILEEENRELRETGDKDNFGAAVQRMKQSGLRGRELAEAIHAEQVVRGMKKPRGPGRGTGRKPGSGSGDEEAEIGGEGKSKGKGQGKGQGKGKGKGKAGESRAGR